MCIRDRYEAPLAMEKEHLAQVVCESLHLECPEPELKEWKEMVYNLSLIHISQKAFRGGDR